jgi:hypothetical protein
MSNHFGILNKGTRITLPDGKIGLILEHTGNGWHNMMVDQRIIKYRPKKESVKAVKADRADRADKTIKKVSRRVFRAARPRKSIKARTSKRKSRIEKTNKKQIQKERERELLKSPKKIIPAYYSSPKSIYSVLSPVLYKLRNPARNYQCLSNNIPKGPEGIEDCLRNIKLEGPVDSTGLIGSGTFGKVYKAKATLNDGTIKDIAIKIIQETSKSKLDAINYELEFSHFMGSMNIGPKVYDAFYYVIGKNFIQYIIMEYFQMNGYDALNKKDINENVCTQMIRLIYKQVFGYEFYCADVKPQNYVVNNTNNPNNNQSGSGIDIKMIDFGTDWCYFENILLDHKYLNKQEKAICFYIILLFQLYYFVIHHFDNNYTVLKIFQKDRYFSNIGKYSSNIRKILYDNDFTFFHYHPFFTETDIDIMDSITSDNSPKGPYGSNGVIDWNYWNKHKAYNNNLLGSHVINFLADIIEKSHIIQTNKDNTKMAAVDIALRIFLMLNNDSSFLDPKNRNIAYIYSFIEKYFLEYYGQTPTTAKAIEAYKEANLLSPMLYYKLFIYDSNRDFSGSTDEIAAVYLKTIDRLSIIDPLLIGFCLAAHNYNFSVPRMTHYINKFQFDQDDIDAINETIFSVIK